MRQFGQTLWKALDKFFADQCPTMAAALSFSTVFSLPALLALLLMLVGTVTDPAAVEHTITEQTAGLIGKAGGEQVATIISQARDTRVNATVAAVLGLVAVLFGATAAFAQLQTALNRAWNVKPDPLRGQIRNFMAKRVFSFGVVITVAFLLLVSLALTALFSAIGTKLTSGLAAAPALLEILSTIISFVLISLLFAFMFKYLPDARIAWRDVRVGAVGTALLFLLGKTVIGLYLGASDPGSAFGAAGSLALVLLWVYYTSIIVLFGAEFTRIRAEKHGRAVQPQKGAVAFVEEERRVKEG
jgi:membrane protein